MRKPPANPGGFEANSLTGGPDNPYSTQVQQRHQL
jgi:hypothetical protein